ncbi:MAG: sugar ABC transporter permease [Ktedonobacteraceae bacterium]|nr:sugar ABC transporter permease [Ktedonobacteraceae bacterium]MBO0793287.1 sugar ABC transporter permease [Ktedonobacteraceae bacterium]
MSDVSIQKQAVQTEGAVSEALTRMKANRWRIDLAGFGFVLPFLILYILFLLWPIILGLRMSFFNWSLDGHGTNDFLAVANYQEALSDPAFWSSLWHTLVFTLLSTPALVLVAFGLALLVNRAIPARGFFRTVFFAPFVLPVSVVVLIWNWLYQPGFGLINGSLTALGLKEVNWLTDTNVAMIAIVLVTVWWTVGFNFVLYLAGMQQVPRELYEASSIDGAGSWARTRWITIPLLGRITSLIVILQVIASLQVFGQIYLLTSGGPNFSTRPIIQYIYQEGFTSFRIGLASAISYLFFILVLIVSIGQFMLFQRERRNA